MEQVTLAKMVKSMVIPGFMDEQKYKVLNLPVEFGKSGSALIPFIARSQYKLKSLGANWLSLERSSSLAMDHFKHSNPQGHYRNLGSSSKKSKTNFWIDSVKLWSLFWQMAAL